MYREKVGWRRFSAILVGFAGVLLIVKPGTDGFNVWSVYALVAVFFVTVRDLSTRRLSKAVPSMTVTLAAVLSVTGFSAFAQLSTPWQPVSTTHWVAITAAAFFVLIGYYLSVQTMRVGDVSFIAPFRYTGLIWALILGWFVFGGGCDRRGDRVVHTLPRAQDHAPLAPALVRSICGANCIDVDGKAVLEQLDLVIGQNRQFNLSGGFLP